MIPEEARVATSSTERIALCTQAAEVIANEYPAIFLFQPYTTYVVDRNHYPDYGWVSQTI